MIQRSTAAEVAAWDVWDIEDLCVKKHDIPVNYLGFKMK